LRGRRIRLIGQTSEAAVPSFPVRPTYGKRGDAFLTAMAEAISQAAGEGHLGHGHKLLFARVWTQCGLDAPAELELSEADEVEIPGGENPPRDFAAVASTIDDMFSGLIEASGGDALDLHSSFAENLATMPPEMRTFIVMRFTERPESICLKLAGFWLLDPAAPTRLAAASALSNRAAKGGLSTEMASKLVMVRSWMPDDDARRAVDQVLKAAMRSGLATASAVKPWTIRSVFASLPDGGGAQSIVISLQSGGSRKSAMVLIKGGHGIKDVFTVQCLPFGIRAEGAESTGCRRDGCQQSYRFLPGAQSVDGTGRWPCRRFSGGTGPHRGCGDLRVFGTAAGNLHARGANRGTPWGEASRRPFGTGAQRADR